MTTIEERFGRRLRLVREAQGESRQLLADLCGVDVSNVARWENGDGSPRGAAMLRLLQHYEQDRDYLIGALGEQPGEHAEVFEAFMQTNTGKRAAAAGLTIALSSIQFANTPSVQLYRVIAQQLLNENDDDG